MQGFMVQGLGYVLGFRAWSLRFRGWGVAFV